MKGQFKAWWVGLVVGVVLVVVGVIVTVRVASGPASFGWFASEPLPGSFWIVTPTLAIAAAVSVAGLLVTSFCGGWLLARRRQRLD